MEITDEAFQGALDILGINGTNNPFLQKAEGSDNDLSKADGDKKDPDKVDDGGGSGKTHEGGLYDDMKKAYNTKKAKYDKELEDDEIEMKKAFDAAGNKNTSSYTDGEGLKKS